MIARHVSVTGRVQGVFFRAWMREQAEALGVTGWVRNCSDGAVEAYAEGDAGDVEELIDLMREGPPGADVGHVDVDTADLEGLNGFEIRH